MHKRDVTLDASGARRRFPDYATEAKSRYEIWWTFGWPYETSAAMARIVFAGIFDKCPGIKIITHHMGGMIPYFEGRVGCGWDVLGSRTSDEDYGIIRESMKPLRPVDYFRNFYADTALLAAPRRPNAGWISSAWITFCLASDVPFEPAPGLYIRETIRCIEALDISAADKEKIYSGDARRLLKLT